MSSSLTTGEARGTFKVVGELSEALAPTGNQVTDFLESYIEIDALKSRSFNWTSFKKDSDSYNGDDFTFDQFKLDTMSDSSALKVSDIIQRVVAFVQSNVVNAEEDELTATIKGLLTNLRQVAESGWGNFSKSKDDPEESSWECRIIFVTPLGKSTGYFRSYVITLKLQAKVADESAWFDLSEDSKLKGVSGVFKLIGLVVTKGFENLLFNTIYAKNLLPVFKPTGLYLLRLLNGQVKRAEGGERSLDWPGLKHLLDTYTGDIATDTFIQSSANAEKQPFSKIVEKIVRFLNSVETLDTKNLTDAISSTFTNLQVKGQSGSLQFSKLSENRSSWEYRFVIFAPMGTSTGHFYSTVVTIGIAADIAEESSWWNLEASTLKAFSANTSAVNLIVGQSIQSSSS